MSTKFSQFNVGGVLAAGDIVVGLRNGINTQFAATAVLPVAFVTINAAQILDPDVGYFLNNAVPTTYTLPPIIAAGQPIYLINTGTSTVTIAQNAGQQVRIGNVLSTLGVGGSIQSLATGDAIQIICNVANQFFVTLGGPQGIWNVV